MDTDLAIRLAVEPDNGTRPLTPSEDKHFVTGTLSDPEAWVDEYGDYLFRYALVKLRDEARAEDMVQETLLAALTANAGFAGKSSPKSWLIGILKNKIADYYRKASRETSFTDHDFFADEQNERFVQEGLFKDAWIHELGPVDWQPNPGAELDKAEFWKAFHECAGKLPGPVHRAFLSREIEEVSTEEICALLNITPNNLWVMLHRARMALRRCLEGNWFERAGGKV
jgi:RNA polymerase sigma-70 factor (ECF subfamily)